MANCPRCGGTYSGYELCNDCDDGQEKIQSLRAQLIGAERERKYWKQGFEETHRELEQAEKEIERQKEICLRQTKLNTVAINRAIEAEQKLAIAKKALESVIEAAHYHRAFYS